MCKAHVRGHRIPWSWRRGGGEPPDEGTGNYSRVLWMNIMEPSLQPSYFDFEIGSHYIALAGPGWDDRYAATPG